MNKYVYIFNEATFREIPLPSLGNVKEHEDLNGNNKTYR